MAKLSKMLELLVLSLRFRLRRALKRFNASKIRAIVVDVDGTFLENGLPIEALKLAYGSRRGSEINKSLEGMYASGELSLDESLIEGHRALMRKGFSRRDWEKLIERSARLHARRNFIEALKLLRKGGMRVILSTKGSYYAAELLSRRFGFDGAVGSEEIFDSSGKITGLKTLLCGKNRTVNGVRVLCDSEFISRKLGLKPSEIAFIYDEFTDIVVMKRGGMFILMDSGKVPWRKLTDISVRFRTYDILLEDPKEIVKVFS